MRKIKEDTVVQFIEWIKNYDDDIPLEETIFDHNLLYDYAYEAISFNILSTSESNYDYIKQALKHSLNDYVDQFLEREDVDMLLKKYTNEHTYRYVHEDFFNKVYRYFTYYLNDYLSYDYLNKDEYECIDADLLTNATKEYLQNQ
ncbi:MAG: hypothetical protein LUG60_04550 [Erysipelotrichaceae bacterium]|nr:hypothetical protein [Erysipelotrichaceae bacterium]